MGIHGSDVLAGLANGLQGAIKGFDDAEDRTYKRRAIAAKIQAQKDQERYKREERLIDAGTRGYDVIEDVNGHVTGLKKNPFLTPDAKPMAPEVRALVEQRTQSLAQKDIIDGNKYLADQYKAGFEPAEMDEEGRVKSFKMLPWKAELVDAEKRYKAARTAKASRVGPSKPVSESKEIFKNLPFENQEQIKKLAGTMANQKAIRNVLVGDMLILDNPNVSKSKKLDHARSMIKTLNSKMGSDAVGAEEAKRLAGLLEMRIIPRIGEPGPWVGRADISEFKEQVTNTMTSLEGSINATESSIQELYGRSPVVEEDAPAEKQGLLPKKQGLLPAKPGAKPAAPAKPAKPAMSQAEIAKAKSWLKSKAAEEHPAKEGVIKRLKEAGAM